MKLTNNQHSEFMKEEMREPEHKKLASMVRRDSRGGPAKGKKLYKKDKKG